MTTQISAVKESYNRKPFVPTEAYRKKQRENYRKLTPEQKLNRSYRAKYKKTYEEISKILEDQEGVCRSCSKPVELGRYNGVVDHCHDTDRIRGILCHECNVLLGLAKDSIQTLRNLVKYLEQNNE